MLVLNADGYSVSRCLEAHLLWLFDYILFNNNHDSTVDKVLMTYTHAIDNVEEGNVPVWSWGSPILAPTY
jgi:hypothetical protein